MMNIIRVGTVFAGIKSPHIHNEIMKIYVTKSTRRKKAQVYQYGSTLKSMDYQNNVVFYVSEISLALRTGKAHIILERDW